MDTGGTRQSILIIDDTPMQVRALSEILSPLYDIKIAKDGEKGLELARKHSVDLILLDILMAGMSGFEVLAELKKSVATRHMPIIFITSMNSSEDEALGLSLGAVDYIAKPFMDDVVRLRVGLHMKLISQRRKIEMLSLLDGLTGIRSRQSFNAKMRAEWDAAAQGKTRLGMLMLGIDRFKDFNSKRGHLSGDLCLKTVAGILKAATENDELVFRWGGDEFALLLPGASQEDAAALAEQIRRSVEDALMPEPVPSADDDAAKATVSIGAGAIAPQPSDRIEAFCANIDSALCKAKQNGRNRVETAAAQ